MGISKQKIKSPIKRIPVTDDNGLEEIEFNVLEAAIHMNFRTLLNNCINFSPSLHPDNHLIDNLNSYSLLDINRPRSAK